jgi:hypothetical protein
MKIAKVISECNECEFCVIADNRRESKSSFAICMFPDAPHFLIAESQTGDISHHSLTIPNNCPLEDYKPTGKDV